MKNWSGKPKRHAVLAVALALVAVQGWAVTESLPVRTHALKVPAKMEMLRPGEVKPKGWLRQAPCRHVPGRHREKLREAVSRNRPISQNPWGQTPQKL